MSIRRLRFPAVRGRSFVVLLFAAAAIVAGCGGVAGMRSPVPSSGAPTAAAGSLGAASLTFRLDGVTQTPAPSAARRTPSFLSPATASITIDISTLNGGTEAAGYPVTVPLTVTSSTCTSSLLTYSCLLSVPTVTPGIPYLATLTTKDASGATLSTVTATFTLVANTANVIGLTLAGVPKSIVVASASTAIVGNSGGGLTIYGTSPQPITVNALDADGDLIIGPGAPTFSVAPVAPSDGWSAATPAPTTPNTIMITPVGYTNHVQQFSVTATSAECPLIGPAFPGAVCSSMFVMTSDIQTLFVLDAADKQILSYTLPLTSSSTATAITNAVASPRAVACDPAGNLFVANGNNTITAYHRPYTSAPYQTITAGINNPAALAFDRYDHLFVSNLATSSPPPTITEYLQPAVVSTPIATITAGSDVTSLATDASGNLFITTSSPQGFQEYAPTSPSGAMSTTPLIAITSPQGGGSLFSSLASIGVDAFENVYVMDSSAGKLYQFGPPYASNASIDLSGGYNAVPFAFNAQGELFTTNGPTSAQILNPSRSAAIIKLYTGISSSFAFAIDGTGAFYSANAGSLVTVYAAPYNGVPLELTVGNIASNATLSPIGEAPQTFAITP